MRGNLRKRIGWLALGAASVVALPVAGEFFVELAREWGLYKQPTARVGAVMEVVAELLQYRAFWWVAGLTAGFAAGVWIDALLAKIDRRRAAAVLARREAADALLARAVSYVPFVAGRLKYVSEVCDGLKDAETFYKKMPVQRIDMRRIVEWHDASLTDSQQSALENLRIQYAELDKIVDYGIDNEAGFNYLHIAHLYRQRARKLGRALNQLLVELSGPGSSPELIPDALLAVEQESL